MSRRWGRPGRGRRRSRGLLAASRSCCRREGRFLVCLVAGLVDREPPVIGRAEVADPAQRDAIVFGDVALDVAVGTAPADGDFFQLRPALRGVVVQVVFDLVFQLPGRCRHGSQCGAPARLGQRTPEGGHSQAGHHDHGHSGRLAVARAASKDVIRLSRRRRRKLERITRTQTAPQREVRRVRIVLLAAARAPNAANAPQLGCRADTVRATRRRYLAEGVRAMKDRPRPGRALVYDIDARLLVIATATSEPAGRILAEADIKLHLVRGWLNRKDDPAFFGKARAICDLYRKPPHGAVLLSIDEKTGI